MACYVMLAKEKPLAWDIGFRLGQISEFSLLIAYVATGASLIGKEASHLIQACDYHFYHFILYRDI